MSLSLCRHDICETFDSRLDESLDTVCTVQKATAHHIGENFLKIQRLAHSKAATSHLDVVLRSFPSNFIRKVKASKLPILNRIIKKLF